MKNTAHQDEITAFPVEWWQIDNLHFGICAHTKKAAILPLGALEPYTVRNVYVVGDLCDEPCMDTACPFNRKSTRKLRAAYGVTQSLGTWKELSEKLTLIVQASSDEAKQKARWARYISPEQKARILFRDGHCCQKCGSHADLEIDHIHPVSKGGTSEDENLQVLCGPCNRRKSDKIECW